MHQFDEGVSKYFLEQLFEKDNSVLNTWKDAAKMDCLYRDIVVPAHHNRALLVGLPKYVQTGTRRFLLNRGYKQETRRRKLKTSKTHFHQAENTRLYMIEETDVNGK